MDRSKAAYSADTKPCEQIGCDAEGTIPIYLATLDLRCFACEAHVEGLVALGWERTDG